MTANAQAAAAAAEVSKALIGAGGTILAALVVAVVGTIGAAMLTSTIQSRRNKQDRESQWRTHAIELTKLDLERRKAKPGDGPGRLPISIFLAHYRDLQKLGELVPPKLYTPGELYQIIIKDNVTKRTPPPPPIEVHELTDSTVVGCIGAQEGGHPLVYLTLNDRTPTTCPYCDRKYILPIC